MSEPKPSTLKSHRRRSPIFVDEPIQWHLRHGRHDRCPWCGLQELKRRGSKKRICDNKVCGASFEIFISQQDWLDTKLLLDEPVDMKSDAFFDYSVEEEGDNHYSLKDAQLRSNTGRGFVLFHRHSSPRVTKIYWHRMGKLPEREDALPACAGGSPYWREIMSLRKENVWVPDDPLNAMEVIARAYGTDEPMFEFSSIR